MQNGISLFFFSKGPVSGVSEALVKIGPRLSQ